MNPTDPVVSDWDGVVADMVAAFAAEKKAMRWYRGAFYRLRDLNKKYNEAHDLRVLPGWNEAMDAQMVALGDQVQAAAAEFGAASLQIRETNRRTQVAAKRMDAASFHAPAVCRSCGHEHVLWTVVVPTTWLTGWWMGCCMECRARR